MDATMWLAPDLTLAMEGEGRISLAYHAGRLAMEWHYSERAPLPVNPFYFGAGLDVPKLYTSDLGPLKAFLDGLPQREAPEGFVFEEQAKQLQKDAEDEFVTPLPHEQALILAQLYAAIYPIFSTFRLQEGNSLFYDGFYGRDEYAVALPYQTAPTYTSFVEEVWGVARKDTLRTTALCSPQWLQAIYSFRGVLPVEYLVSAAATASVRMSGATFPAGAGIYQPLMRLSLPQRRALFEKLLTQPYGEGTLVTDTLAMLEQVPEQDLKRLKGITTWERLHDETLRRAVLEASSDALTAMPTALRRLNGAQVQAYSLKLLTAAQDFLTTGEHLDICIGKAGYYMKALRGESYCFTGEQAGALTFALEVASDAEGVWAVKQLRGFKNKTLDHHEALVTMIGDLMNGGKTHG